MENLSCGRVALRIKPTLKQRNDTKPKHNKCEQIRKTHTHTEVPQQQVSNNLYRTLPTAKTFRERNV